MAPANASHYCYNTPYGPITVEAKRKHVCFVGIGRLERATTYSPSETGNICATEILQYLSGRRKVFTVPQAQPGSEFQHAVWTEVCKIPYGQHRTAAQIAQNIGRPSSHKAVGAALRANQLAIIVPTHRVTNTSGKAWGVGKEARIRDALLHMEEKYLKNSSK